MRKILASLGLLTLLVPQTMAQGFISVSTGTGSTSVEDALSSAAAEPVVSYEIELTNSRHNTDALEVVNVPGDTIEVTLTALNKGPGDISDFQFMLSSEELFKIIDDIDPQSFSPVKEFEVVQNRAFRTVPEVLLNGATTTVMFDITLQDSLCSTNLDIAQTGALLQFGDQFKRLEFGCDSQATNTTNSTTAFTTTSALANTTSMIQPRGADTFEATATTSTAAIAQLESLPSTTPATGPEHILLLLVSLVASGYWTLKKKQASIFN